MNFVKVDNKNKKLPVLEMDPYNEPVSAEELRKDGWTVTECTVAYESGTAYFAVRTNTGELRWFPIRWG
jgi:hypothetical protein